MAIKNIVFDFGGVLLDWDPRYIFRDYFKDDAKMEYFLGNICTSTWNAQMDCGRTFAECTAELKAQHPEFAREIDLYRSGWGDMLKGEIPAGIAMFKAMRDSGRFKLYGLTNWSHETFPGTFTKYPFLADFEGIVVSGEEKMIKPDKRLFMVLLERYHLKAAESIFIDDNAANIATAAKLGFNTIHCQDHAKAKEEMIRLTGYKF